MLLSQKGVEEGRERGSKNLKLILKWLSLLWDSQGWTVGGGLSSDTGDVSDELLWET